MPTSNQDKGYVNMKKLIALVAVLFSVVVPVQSQAAETKALVVIDSYFDSRAVDSNVTCIVIVKNVPCTDEVKKFPTSMSDNLNHGNAMIAVAQRQNPSIKIIALRSASSPSSDVNAGNFIEALTWVNNNSGLVSAISFSRYFNGVKVCSPASINTAPYGGVAGANQKIVALVNQLKSKNIPVFASTGNKMGKPVDYPACLLEVDSVGVGSLNSAGKLVSVYQHNTNTDYFASATVSSYITKLGIVPNTTSAGTVSVATHYSSGAVLPKVVAVIK
jgi:hypothetical protein